jgi:deoxyribodipyrimidine photo-lyase
LPIRAVDTVFPTAYAFRRVLQQRLPAHLSERPSAQLPPAGALPPPPAVADRVRARWPDAFTWLDTLGGSLASLPIDHAVAPTGLAGGEVAARERLRAFLASDLGAYAEQRNHPDRDATSQLSPYLHWGHISSHEVFHTLMAREGWLGNVAGRATGAREGWWGVSPAAEAFIDQLVTWRELGYNMAARRDDHTEYASLPEWARRTLDAHAGDPRPHLYSFERLDHAETDDALWNAAQRQLRREGRIHTYLRMLWGKKILEWTASPQDALAAMIALNDRYALDGRDPNSYSGIFWTLGRYDRPWAPTRPIFGAIRYMSSANTARKLRVREYLTRYPPD